MKNKGLDPGTVDEWLDLAFKDLKSAEGLSIINKEKIFSISADSVEKSLKAFLFYSNPTYNLKNSFGHDLEKLIKGCIKIDKKFQKIHTKVDFLKNVEYGNEGNLCETHVQIAYNPKVIISEEQATYARNYAKEIYNFIKSKISK